MAKPIRNGTNNKKKQKGKKKQPLVQAPANQPSTTAVTTPQQQGPDYKTIGNDLFSVKRYSQAVEAYTEGLKDENIEKNVREVLLMNRVMALLKLDKYGQAKKDCDLLIQELNVTQSSKLWYRRATSIYQQVRKESDLNLHDCTELLKEALANAERSEQLQPEPDKAVISLRTNIGRLLDIMSKAKPESAPSFEEQRDDILRLLKAHAGGTIRPNEAFFLIQWKWWCVWCTYTGMLNEVHRYLPGSNRREPQKLFGKLSPIDNTSLNAHPSPEWYYSSNCEFRLRPDLVRGFHYEILPREVYHALVLWYTECTPAIVLRTTTTNAPQPQLVVYHTEPPLNNIRAWCGACGTPVTSKKRCQACSSVFYCDRLCQERHWKASHRQDCGNGPVRRRRVGLNNLGNTCFMNAAVMALFHATPIVRTFLSGKFEISQNNPLSSGGRLALAFAQTMETVWNARTSVSPVALKRAIGVVQPRFAGYSQHDAQEFLSFLLDGLHEDLNESDRKYYDDPPDGVTAWHAQCQRNASVLWDHVYGQFQSTCVCPDCQYESVSFDAFNHVSLELPAGMRPVIVALVRPGRPVEQVVVQLVTHATTGALINEVRKCVEGLPEEITVCEVEQGVIQSALPETRPLADCEGVPHIYPGIDINSSNEILLVGTHVNREGRSIGFPMLLSLPKDGAQYAHIHELVRKSINHDANWDQLESISLAKRDGTPINKFESVDENGERFLTSIIPDSEDAIDAKVMFIIIEWSVTAEEENDFLIITNNPSVESLVPERTLTLQKCIETFTKPERLDQNNMWYCSKCKKHVQAMKTMGMWKLPNILILHLKRFKHSLRREKLDTLVDFPLEGLEVPHCNTESDDFVASPDPAVYDCFGVVNHYGRMGVGHYTAMCREWNETGIDDDWCLFDDSSTQPIENVVSPAAYVLFYRRRSFC